MLLTALQELPFGPLKTEKSESKIFTIHSRSFLIWSLNYLLSYFLLSISNVCLIGSLDNAEVQSSLRITL